tara:strand:- start:14758 stop:16485 length:1728 start_codon:yes stop_codon:yes gene_type:complete
LNLENNNTDKDKKKPTEFNRKAFKHAISVIESNGGKYMEAFNGASGSPSSSAAGRYHFLYNSIKKDPLMKGISKRKFMNSTYLQEAVMDKALDGNLKGYSYGEGKAREIIESSGTDHDVNDVAAMIHFLGAKGTRDYLKNKDNYQVSGEVNKTGNEYVENFRKEFDSFAAQPEEENNVRIDRSPNIPQDIPQDTVPQNVAPVQEAGPFIQPEIPTDESIQPAFNYSQERESGKSQEAFIPSDGVEGPSTTMNNTFKEGGSIDECKCDCEGKPPCVDRPMTKGETANTLSNMASNVSKYFFNTEDEELKESPYKPTVSSDPEAKYYYRSGMREDVYKDLTSEKVKKDYNHNGSFKDIYAGLKSNGSDRQHNADKSFPKNKAGYKGQYNKGHGSLVGQYNLARYVTDAGEDEKGKYISFSDTYDWNGMKTENAFNFYDRIYESEWDDYNNKKREEVEKQFKKLESYDNKNKFEDGGDLGNQDASEEVIEFKGGGTHEENSLGGIPQGTGANGKPNLVEEGETKWNDYIFSNAIDTSGNFTSPEGSKSNVFEKGGNLKKLKMLASKGGSNNINDYKLS